MGSPDEAIALEREALEKISVRSRKRPMILFRLGQHLHKRYLQDHPFKLKGPSSLPETNTKTKTRDLDEAIEVTKEAMQAFSRNRRNKARASKNLGEYLYHRFKATSNLDDLNGSIEAMQSAIELGAFTPQRAQNLITLGQLMYQRCLKTMREERVSGLQEAIRVTHIGLASTIEPTDRAMALSCLGDYLYDRYQFGTQNPDDLEEAIRISQTAIELSAGTKADTGRFLFRLGRCLAERYAISDGIPDLEKAIEALHKAAELCERGIWDRIKRLITLSEALSSMFIATECVTHIELAVQAMSTALHELPPENPRKLELLLKLGGLFERKFEKTDNLDDLEKAIQVFRKIADATSDDHKDRSYRLFALAMNLRKLHTKTRAREALEEAIDVVKTAEHAAKDRPLSGDDYLKHLGAFRRELIAKLQSEPNLEEKVIRLTQAVVNASGTSLKDKTEALVALMKHMDELCDASADFDDIDESIQAIQAGINVTPPGHSSRIILYKHLADHMANKCDYADDLSDLPDAINLLKEASAMAPKDHQYVTEIYASTRARMDLRWKRTETSDALDDAIQFFSSQAHLEAEDDETRFKILARLGEYLSERYVMRLAMRDLEEAITSTRKALELCPSESSKPRLYKTLGSLFALKYRRTNDLNDIEESISFAERSVDESCNHMSGAGRLNNLSIMLRTRYERTDSLTDLERAITLSRKAIEHTLRGPFKSGYLSSLARHLCARFKRLGNMADLEESIQTARTAADIAPTSHPTQQHPDQAEFFAGLGYCLHLRFLELEIMSDLEEAIQVLQKAVNLTPKGVPEKASYLNSLSIYLSGKYRRSELVSDLDAAIDAAYACLDAAPDDHPDRALVLRNLGGRLADRFALSNEMDELNKAIQYTRDSLSFSSNEIDQASALDSLGMRLAERFRSLGQTADIDESIQNTQNAVDKTPKGVQRSAVLRNLSLHYIERSNGFPDSSDVDEAIQAAEEAVENTPIDHPERAEMWCHLGSILEDKFARTRKDTDLRRAISCHKSALKQLNASVVVRIEASTNVLRCCVPILEWEEAFEALETAISLTPLLTSRSVQNSDKQHLFSQVVGLASDGAAMAFNASKNPHEALKLLEQGRGLLAESLEEMRADVKDLRKRHPDLAEEFFHVQGELTLQSKREEHDIPAGQSSTFHVRTSQPYQADRAFEQLLADIRKLPDFEGFLLPPTTDKLQAAAISGPIVVINMSEYRCDAILVETDRVRALPLPGLKSKEVDEKSRRNDLASPAILAWLWDTVAEPVLTALGFDQTISTEEWPHVWWVPTGSLTRFPLHAAGRHESGCGETVLDRVMSSYNSSVKAIINGRQRSALSDGQPGPARALLVSMKITPSYAPLHFADREVDMLQDICKEIPLDPVRPGQLRQDIVAQLPRCSIFHFAGHGYVDMKDPSQSYLAVYDGKITVATLLEMNLRDPSPFLAYLSACGTGQIKDDRFVDESIHLISACQSAGFRHVVGTLWEVNDELCVEMASITYGAMRDRGLNDAAVCLGVHRASRKLRDKWLSSRVAKCMQTGKTSNVALIATGIGSVTSREASGIDNGLPRDIIMSFDNGEGREEQRPSWAPYVHFGV